MAGAGGARRRARPARAIGADGRVRVALARGVRLSGNISDYVAIVSTLI